MSACRWLAKRLLLNREDAREAETKSFGLLAERVAD